MSSNVSDVFPKVLKLSSEVSECKPLLMGTTEDMAESTAVADECDQLLQRAAEADPKSAEPLQAMASLRSEQGRKEEALEAGAYTRPLLRST